VDNFIIFNGSLSDLIPLYGSVALMNGENVGGKHCQYRGEKKQCECIAFHNDLSELNSSNRFPIHSDG
jgi:hypothetical protein